MGCVHDSIIVPLYVRDLNFNIDGILEPSPLRQQGTVCNMH